MTTALSKPSDAVMSLWLYSQSRNGKKSSCFINPDDSSTKAPETPLWIVASRSKPPAAHPAVRRLRLQRGGHGAALGAPQHGADGGAGRATTMKVADGRYFAQAVDRCMEATSPLGVPHELKPKTTHVRAAVAVGHSTPQALTSSTPVQAVAGLHVVGHRITPNGRPAVAEGGRREVSRPLEFTGQDGKDPVRPCLGRVVRL